MKSYQISFISPLFSKGAYEELPEIRPASIRGQLHHWLRILGGSTSDERAIFGSVHGNFGGNNLKASRSGLIVRVADQPKPQMPVQWVPTLPHKPTGQNPRNAPNAPRISLPVNTSFTLHLIHRGTQWTDLLNSLLERTVDAWLLAGSLGLRATRGGGSLLWNNQPTSYSDYKKKLEDTFKHSYAAVFLCQKPYNSVNEIRVAITNTLAHDAFIDQVFPLGAVKQGKDDRTGAPNRKTSPLRLTIRKIENNYHIIAVWDGRQEVTGNTWANLQGAISLLKQAGKPLGDLLPSDPHAWINGGYVSQLRPPPQPHAPPRNPQQKPRGVQEPEQRGNYRRSIVDR